MSMIGHNQPPHTGYILIFRQLLSHPVVGAGKPVTPHKKGLPTYSRLEAWLDLLMMAVYDDETVTVNGFKFDLKRGDTVCAVAYLSKRWNWSSKTVRGFIERLQKHEMIERKGLENGKAKDKRPNHLSVCNYSQYQDGAQYGDFEKGKGKGNREGNRQGKQKTGLSLCKQKRIDFSSAGKGQAEGQAEGQRKGRQYKTNNNQTNQINQAANSELDKHSGLNGSTSTILRQLAGWIYLDSFEGQMDPQGQPLQPHFEGAQSLLQSSADAYGSQVVKEAFTEMQANLMHKRDVRNHTKLFLGHCRKAHERLAVMGEKTKKVVRA